MIADEKITKPADWNEEEREKAICFVASLTLAKNRRRQSLFKAQIQIAYRERNTEALRHLQAMLDIEAEGILRREFP